MSPGRLPRRGCALAATALLILFLLQNILSIRLKSAVFDEPVDIAAGLSYIQTGRVDANPQHPPLLKELAGLSLFASGLRLPAGSPADGAAGVALLRSSGADRVLFAARLPFLLLSTALGLVLFLWARQLLGDLPALCALFLCTFDPTVLGHAGLATMDAGLAAFTLLFFFVLWNYLQRPSLLRLLLCGAVLGCLLCTKFSAVFLVPVAAVLLLAAPRNPDASLFPGLRGFPAALCAFLTMCLAASVVVQILYLSPGGLYLYTSGMSRVNADHNPDYLVLLAGHLSHHFAVYFAAAWLLKEPLAALALTAIGVVVLRRSALLPKLFLVLPPAVLFLVHSVLADDLGIRYVLPVVPFACLAAGAGAAWLIRHPGRWARPMAAVLGAWLVVAAVGIFPDHLSYFNEAACLTTRPSQIGLDGGSRCGPAWLDDSNVDWGQGLKQLKSWLDTHPGAGPVRVAYAGAVPPDVYGLQAQRLGIDDLLQPPPPGRIAVSAHWVARVPALAAQLQAGNADWLRRPPAAVVAHAWYVFDIPPSRR